MCREGQSQAQVRQLTQELEAVKAELEKTRLRNETIEAEFRTQVDAMQAKVLLADTREPASFRIDGPRTLPTACAAHPRPFSPPVPLDPAPAFFPLDRPSRPPECFPSRAQRSVSSLPWPNPLPGFILIIGWTSSGH